MGTRCADHVTPLYPQKLALTSPTGGGCSVGIVCVRTKATELVNYILNRARGAEVRLLELYVLSSLSLGYRPGIGCRERVKDLGVVTESFLVGQLKPGISLALELAFGA